MKVIQYQEPYTTENGGLPEYYKHFYPDSRLLFIDIETTGFAAQNTTLYLIGVLWYEEDCIRITQWFNEDGRSENEILAAFNHFCGDFTHLVHFNGLGFDLPYLIKKAALLDVPFEMNKNLNQIDIYKEIRSYKKIFSLDNMKQTSIEQYLGISRQDAYSGKELIHIYQRYVAKPDKKAEEQLLLHNHDDLLGMPQISKILNYKAFFEKPNISSIETKIEQDKLIITLTCNETAPLPKRISLSHNGIYLNASGQKAALSIPVFSGTLKHYFKDYKNYYYLPKEDMAIHKSVAAFVEPENKQKATPNTCYTQKKDIFIPCMDDNCTETFQKDATENNKFQTLESLKNKPAAQIDYIKQVLQLLL